VDEDVWTCMSLFCIKAKLQSEWLVTWGKSKVKVILCLHITLRRFMGVEVWREAAPPWFLTSALDGRGSLLHAPAALPPVPIGQEAGWAPEPVWTLWRREKPLTLLWIIAKIFSPEPVASPYWVATPLNVWREGAGKVASLDPAHCMKYISYIRLFGCRLYSAVIIHINFLCQ